MADDKKTVEAPTGKVQKNQALKVEDNGPATVQGVGEVAVQVNPERNAGAVEILTVDEDGNAAGEVFEAGVTHKVTNEVADLTDVNGQKYFVAAE